MHGKSQEVGRSAVGSLEKLPDTSWKLMEAEEGTKAMGRGWERAMGGWCGEERTGACTWRSGNGGQGELNSDFPAHGQLHRIQEHWKMQRHEEKR